MNKRRMESLLAIAAVALLVWGGMRAIERGDPVIRAWTTYFMFGLGAAAGSNIYIRSKRLAVTVCAFCILFILLAASAAWLEMQAGEPHPPLAVVRAALFFTLLGAASWIQIRSSSTMGGGRQVAPADDSERSRR